MQLNSNAHVPLAVLHQGVQARRPVANVAKLILVEFPLWIRYQNESNSTEPWLKTWSLKFEWLVPTMVSSMEARSLFLCVCVFLLGALNVLMVLLGDSIPFASSCFTCGGGGQTISATHWRHYISEPSYTSSAMTLWKIGQGWLESQMLHVSNVSLHCLIHWSLNPNVDK